MPNLNQQLEKGIDRLGLDLPDQAVDLFVAYIKLLEKWNRSYNLTAVRDPRQMVTRHILDSLAILPHVQGERILDVGSGPGLPGIPLAIARPHWHVTLLDSNGKKTRFLNQALMDLPLKNADVAYTRLEDFRQQPPYNTAVARAFSSAANLARLASPHVVDGGCILSMKGAYPVAEMDELQADFPDNQVLRLEVPGLDAERHLVIIHCRDALAASV